MSSTAQPPSKRCRTVPSNPIFVYQLPNFKNNLALRMQQLYTRGDFCDLVLTDEHENDEIHVHGVVIVSAIPVLKRYWKPSSGHNKLVIDINAKLLRAIVHFCYYGEIRINNEANLLDLYKFCVNHDYHKFDQFLLESLNNIISTTNAVSIFLECDGHDEFHLLRKICKDKIIEDISTICCREDFSRLTVSNLTEIFSNENLMVESEEKVLEIFLKWYYNESEMTLDSTPDETTRKMSSVAEVLASIRLPMIDLKYIEKFENIWKDNGAHDDLLKYYKWHVFKQHNSDDCVLFENSRMTPRFQRQNMGCHIPDTNVEEENPGVIVGMEVLDTNLAPEIPDTVMEAEIPDAVVKTEIPHILKAGVNRKKRCISMEFMSIPDGKWISLPDLKYSLFRENTAFVMLDKENIMIIGGGTIYGSVSVELVNLRTAKTQRLASLLVARFGHAVATWNNFVYIAGGISDRGKIMHDEVERYDPCTNSWEFIPSLSQPRADFKLIVFQDTLYALGGQNGGESFNTVEYFDVGTNSWTITTPMLTARCDFAAAVHNNRIYVIGGNQNKHGVHLETASVEYFDPDTKTWTNVAPLGHPRDVLSAVVYDEQLFAIGGWTSKQKMDKTVEKYDDINNVWIPVDKLSAPMGNTTAFVVPNNYVDQYISNSRKLSFERSKLKKRQNSFSYL